jgi:hypothetical protein
VKAVTPADSVLNTASYAASFYQKSEVTLTVCSLNTKQEGMKEEVAAALYGNEQTAADGVG